MWLYQSKSLLRNILQNNFFLYSRVLSENTHCFHVPFQTFSGETRTLPAGTGRNSGLVCEIQVISSVISVVA